MGIISSLLGWNQGRTDDPDPATGLTSRDKYLIRASWEPIKKDSTKNGVAFFMLLFQMYPEEQRHFPFRDTPLAELPPDKKFQAHCNTVMYAITMIVDSLDDAGLLTGILLKTAQNHKRNRIAPESFWNVKKVLLVLFEKVAMSKDSLAAWDKALEVSFKIIADNL